MLDSAGLRHIVIRASAFALAAAIGVPLAQAQTVIINNQTVSVPPSLGTLDQLIVGETGTGTLNVNAGGYIPTGNTIIGDQAGSSGIVNVGGAGARIGTEGLTVGNNGTGTLSITNGGVVDGMIQSAFIGFSNDAPAIASVSGAGSTLRIGFGSNLLRDLYVAYGGAASLTVEDGGAAIAQDVYVGYENGVSGSVSVSTGGSFTSTSVYLGYDNATGTINISGAGSLWAVTGSTVVGNNGTGALNITAGGEMTTSGAGTVASAAGSSGSVTVSGMDSQWTQDSLTVGDAGNATMSIAAGGGVTTTNAAIVANAASSTSSVTVSGAGSTWSSDTLTIGNAGDATMTVSGGGSVTSNSATIANASSSASSATVTGTGSSWNAGALVVGNAGAGTLTISSGGVVTSTSATVADDAGTTSSASVTGTGSTWNAGALTVGNAGSGTLSVGGGGVVSGTTGRFGEAAGSTGTATVTGAGSQLNFSSNLFVGNSGTATLNVTNGATFSAGVVIAGRASGNGTINLNGGSTATTTDVYLGAFTSGQTGTGTANITGAGTAWTMQDFYVGYYGAGTASITDGAQVDARFLGMGYSDPGATASLTISGAGSRLSTNYSYVELGNYGPATVVVSNGGLFEQIGEVYTAEETTGPTHITVTGAGSQWNMTGGLTNGYAGEGTVTVTNGASVSAGALYNGYYGGGVTYYGHGIVEVLNAGTFTLTGDAYSGYYADSTMTVASGGVLGVGGDLYAGYSSYYGPISSSISVSGAGSQLNVAGDAYAGYYGDSTITVAGGAVLAIGGNLYTSYSGYYGPISSSISVSGTGSQLTVGGEMVLSYGDFGSSGPTDVTVSNGGLLSVAGPSYVGGGDVGTVIVTGNGSKWIGNDIEIGAYRDSTYTFSRGDVTVSAGGAVQANSITIGSDNWVPGSPGVGNLLVTGNGSSVSVAGAFTVGGAGEGTATLTNGGTVTAASTSIASAVGSTGTLIFGAKSGDPAAAPGTLNSPTLAFGAGSGEIVFNHTSNAFNFAPALSGTGDIDVISGTTRFTTDSSGYAGAIDVSGGKAVFNADYSGGDVTVSGSGIVGGVGSIASLDVQTGGTVAPGNSPGTLSVVGNVAFAAGTTYAVEVNRAQHDLIDAGGTATISGGTVLVSGTPALMTYTILTAAGGRTGEFDGLSSTSAFYLYSLDYDANNVYLVVDGIRSFTIAARTPNQYAVANALDQFPDSSPLVSAVATLGIDGAAQAFNALSGEIHGSVGSAMADDTRYVREAITGRLIQSYYGGVGAGGGTPIVMAAAAPTDVVEMDSSSRMSLGAGYGASRGAPSAGHDLAWWSRAFGAWGQYDSNGNAATTDRNLGGFVTGVDGNVGSGWRAGLATGYLNTSLSAGGERYSSADINSYVLGAYAGGGIGEFALRSGGTWTWNKIDTDRSVVFPGFFEGESASYNGDVGQLFAELAYPIFTHGGVIEPFAGLAYVHVGTDSFTESGPIAGLTSGGLNMNLGYGTLGARAGTTVVWGGTTVIPHVSAAWQYAFGDTTPEIAMAFASTGIGMGIGGVPLAQNSALLDIGADAVIAPDMTLGISYMGQYSGDFTDNGLRGRFNWKF